MTQVVDPAAKDTRSTVQKLRDRLKVSRRDTSAPVDDQAAKTPNEPNPIYGRSGPFENARQDSDMSHASTLHERLAKRIAENTPAQDVGTPGMTDIAGHGLRTPKDYEIVPAAADPRATAPTPGNVGLVKEIEDLAAHFSKRGMARTAAQILTAVHQCKIEGGV